MDMKSYTSALKQRGMKLTPQRQLVHEAMMALKVACADSLCDWISENGKGAVSVASVYNILKQMASCGIYQCMMSADNKMYFSVDNTSLIHLYNRVDNTFREVPDDGIMDIVAEHFRTRRFRGYKLENVHIQLVCRPTSRKKSKRI